MSEGTVVDLFCGAGGASLGFVDAGYEVRGAVDIDDDALDTYEANLCKKGRVKFDEPMQADLSETSFAEIRDFFGLEPGEVDVICGCPPCQNFSSLRDTEPWPEGEAKDALLQAFVELIREEKPDYVFFENVPGILNAGEDVPTTYVDWFKQEMKEVTREGDDSEVGGYGVNLEVVNAANYGIPQRRRRTVAICAYGVDSKDIEFPEKTHAEDPEGNKQEWVTIADTLKRDNLKQDLELGQKQVDVDGYPTDPGHRARRHQDSTVEMIEAIREYGDSWSDLRGTEDENLIKECHRGLDGAAQSAYGIMSWDEPAPTLTTRCANVSSGRFTHPEESRSITFREAALLMTFPRWFELPEKNGAAERVVGNAVPPKMIKNIVEIFSDIPTQKSPATNSSNPI